MTHYLAPSPDHEKNRVRVKIVSGPTAAFRVGDTYCPPAGNIPTLLQRNLVERVHTAEISPAADRMMAAKGRRGARYATRA